MLAPFAPAPGIISDDTTFARPGVWADGSNVRFRMGKPQVIGGWVDATNDTLTGVCRNAYAWLNASAISQIAFGTHSALEVFSSGTVYDITPAGLVAGSTDSSSTNPGWGSGGWGEGTWGDPASIYYARTWSFSTYGDTLIANPRGGTIYSWENDTSSVAAAVTNAPAEVTFAMTTQERQLLAFGCNEETSGDFNPLCIRGSDIEDITAWATAVDNNAFEHILEGVGGRIVAAAKVGSYVAVWTDRALVLGQFIGDPGQTYRFDIVGDNCGLAGPNALAVRDQTAVWLGSDLNFRIWTLGGVPQILPCPILGDFKDNLDITQIEKVVATTIMQFSEVWFFYPDTRDGSEASRYIAYSFSESVDGPVWFRGQLARTQAMDAGATTYPVMTTVDGATYYHEDGSDADGSSITWSLKSGDTYIEEGERQLMVRRLDPDFKDQGGDISLTIYARQWPMDTATTLGPYTVANDATKVDFRASGRLLALEFSGTDYARFGTPTIDAVATGRR